MVFTVLVADGGGANLELNFPSKPSLGVLKSKAEGAFRRNGGGAIVKMRVQDRNDRWEDLHSPEQLSAYSQVLALQASRPPQQRATSPTSSYHSQQQQPRSSNSHRPTSPTSPTQTVPYNSSVSRARSPPPGRASPIDEALPGMFEEKKRDVPFDAKVEGVFNELDVQKARAVGREAFIEVFNLVPSLKGDAPKIFQRCDANRDGSLDIAEFRSFAQLYPAVLEALFHRIRSEEMTRLQVEEIRKTEESVRAQTAEEANCAKVHADVQQNTRKLEAQLQKQMETLTASHAREQRAKKGHEEARVNVADARARLQAAAVATDKLKSAESETHHRMQALEGDISQQNRVLSHEKDAHDAAVARLLELQRMLEEQQRVVAQHESRVHDAARTLQGINESHSNETDSMSQLDTEKRQLMKHIADSDCAVASAVEAEREALSRHRDATNEVARVQAKRDLLEREMNQSREREGVCRAEQRDAASGVTNTAKQLGGMKQAHETSINKRREAEKQEHNILQQEVELRNKKDEVERFEASLRSEHRHFASRYN